MLSLDGHWYYTDGEPSSLIIERLASRRDNQIMAYESTAILLGFTTFPKLLSGGRVVVWSDNKGADARRIILYMPHVLCSRRLSEKDQPGAGTIIK